MRTSPISIIALSWFVLIGCSGSGSSESGPSVDTVPVEPRSDDAKPDAAKPAADAQAVAGKKAAAKAKIAADEAELATRRTNMLTALNAGRKLVKDGDLQAGIKKYEELLAIDPHYGPALGELGWAEFKANELDDAHAHTLRALGLATDDNKRGMLLYNLGRIAEQRGQPEVAIGHYQVSLGFRANDTVAARLAGLTPDGAAVASPSPSGPTGLTVIARGLADVPAMCEAAAKGSLCSNDSCELLASPAGNPDAGALLTEDMGMISCYSPAIKTATGWVVFDTAAIGQHGSEIHQDVDSITSRIENSDAGEFLWIEYSDHIYERMWDAADYADLAEDSGYPPDDSTDTRGVILCSLGPTPACTPAITVEYAFDGSGRKASYAATLSLRGDSIVIADVSQSGDVELGRGGLGWDGHLMLAAGEYSFATLSTPAP